MIRKLAAVAALVAAPMLFATPAHAATVPNSTPTVTQPLATYRWVAGPVFPNIDSCGQALWSYIDGYYVNNAYCYSGPNGEAVMFLHQLEGASI